MQLYNPATGSVYTNDDYKLDPGNHTNIQFGLNHYGEIFVVTYISYSYPASGT